jgi:hypothetical protein
MGDVDGADGYAEILSGGHARSGPTMGLYLWRYSGSNWAQQTITTEGSYGGVALADVTGDKILDAVAAGDSGWGGGSVDGVVIWKGVLIGSVLSFTQLTSPYSTTSSDSVAAGDIEPDGDVDLVLGTNGAGIKVFVNDGSPTPYWTTISISQSGETTGVALGDLNNDNHLDITATNYNGNNARVFLCTGTAPVTYGSAHTSGLSTGTAFGIGVADFNADNKNDLAIGSRGGFDVYLGNGCSGADNTWWTAGTVSASGSGDRMQVAVGDINKDSKIDVVCASGSGIVVLENDGTGSFTKVNPTGVPASGSYYGCCLLDWDGDGDLDLAACGWGNGVHFYQNDLYAVSELPSPALALAVICGVAIFILPFARSKKPTYPR